MRGIGEQHQFLLYVCLQPFLNDHYSNQLQLNGLNVILDGRSSLKVFLGLAGESIGERESKKFEN